MNVLMLSIDKTLLGEQIKGIYGYQGDTIKRHKQYGEIIDRLDIIVTSKPGFKVFKISEKVYVYPTNARTAWGHFRVIKKYIKSKNFSASCHSRSTRESRNTFVDCVQDIYSRFRGNDRAGNAYDLIVTQDLVAQAALYIKKKYNIPYIITTHAASLENIDFKKGLRGLLLPFIVNASKHADGLRVVSPEVKKYYEDRGITCPIEVIPTASDYSIFSEIVLRPASRQGEQASSSVPTEVGTTADRQEDNKNILNKLNNKYIILTDGRLEPVKNYPLLFEVFRVVKQTLRQAQDDKNIKLLIIGTGSLEKKLKKMAQDMGLAEYIEFLGSMQYENLPKYYKSADVFVLTSDSESFGKVLLQAGAAGVPVVATNTVGARSIIKHSETGFLVKIGDKELLAKSIVKLLQDNELRSKMGGKAQKHVRENYDASKNIQKFVDFWKRIAEKRKTALPKINY